MIWERNSRRAGLALLLALGALVAAGCGREDPEDLVNGKELFITEARCGTCHVLDRAGTAGTIGPDLDEAFGPARRAGMGEETIAGIVEQQIAHPLEGSQMPADLVTGENAEDVAAYVAEVAGVPGEDEGKLAAVGGVSGDDPEQIYNALGCGSCHTLAAAGSTSDIGPNLNQLAEDAERFGEGDPEEYVRQAITDPSAFIVPDFEDVMPAFADRLEPEQLDALVQYLLEQGGG